MLSDNMRRFISGMLHIEIAGDPPIIKNGTLGSSEQFQEDVESGLRELLRTRELSVLDYYDLTYVEFPSEDGLYAYLQKVYNYLFEGADELPRIPDD